ncbi:serine/threonine-protein kinase [Calycomorphotria hydatis]|nr:serine/threonine-protein kinase [Calycomorphotria hydatis]
MLAGNFGRYTIDCVLGNGSMGFVYKAHDTILARTVALKIPRLQEGGNQTFLKRLYREAISVAALNHPYICPIYDVGEHDGVHYLSMAYISGKSLNNFLENGEQVHPRTAAIFVRKVAQAMAEAHRRAVIHRDLKPDNIMVNRLGNPVVMDFGLARNVSKADDPRLTMQGFVVGTPAYLSPEQLRGGTIQFGPYTDIYSLGVILFQLLTGQLPFPGDGSIGSVFSEVLKNAPPKPSELCSQVPVELSDICHRAIQKDRKARYRSMEQFAEAIKNYLLATRDSNASPGQDGHFRLTTLTPSEIRALEQRKIVEMLFNQHEYGAARTILQRMISLEDGQIADITDWARQQLPKVDRNVEKTNSPPSIHEVGSNGSQVVSETKRFPATSSWLSNHRIPKRRLLQTALFSLAILFAFFGLLVFIQGFLSALNDW